MSGSGSIIASLVGRLTPSRDRKKQDANEVLTEEQEEEIVDIFKVRWTTVDTTVQGEVNYLDAHVSFLM